MRHVNRREISEKLLTFTDAFRQKIIELTASNTCYCNACQNIAELQLKVVVHTGEALFYEINGLEELAGPDVIIVHRLWTLDNLYFCLRARCLISLS